MNCQVTLGSTCWFGWVDLERELHPFQVQPVGVVCMQHASLIPVESLHFSSDTDEEVSDSGTG